MSAVTVYRLNFHDRNAGQVLSNERTVRRVSGLWWKMPPERGMKHKSRLRQWSRAALGLALLLASLPLASRLALGNWGFTEAGELAVLFLGLSAYLEIQARRFRTLRDDASALEKALDLASQGKTEKAIAILTSILRLSPRLWQAYQYRGQLYLRQELGVAAVQDFSEAIRLAPAEAHLYTLRSQAYQLLGDEEGARQDEEAARAFLRNPT